MYTYVYIIDISISMIMIMIESDVRTVISRSSLADGAL